MIVIGHRGAAGLEPENTLRSIARAMELGADWVEIDIRSAGGNLIVFHDDTLERTTNGRGRVDTCDFAKLRALDAGKGERVPLLGEVLDLIDARIGLNVELKGPGVAPAVIAVLRDYLARQPLWRDRLLLSSFDMLQTELAAAASDLRLGLLYREPSSVALCRAQRLKAWSIHPALRYVTPELVEAAHARALRVLVYTVNSKSDLRRMLDYGVDGVFTDYPDRARAVLAAAAG